MILVLKCRTWQAKTVNMFNVLNIHDTALKYQARTLENVFISRRPPDCHSITTDY